MCCFISLGLNVRFSHCFAQEDWNRFCIRIAERCHKSTLGLGVLRCVYLRLRFGHEMTCSDDSSDESSTWVGGKVSRKRGGQPAINANVPIYRLPENCSHSPSFHESMYMAAVWILWENHQNQKSTKWNLKFLKMTQSSTGHSLALLQNHHQKTPGIRRQGESLGRPHPSGQSSGAQDDLHPQLVGGATGTLVNWSWWCVACAGATTTTTPTRTTIA